MLCVCVCVFRCSFKPYRLVFVFNPSIVATVNICASVTCGTRAADVRQCFVALRHFLEPLEVAVGADCTSAYFPDALCRSLSTVKAAMLQLAALPFSN